VAAALCLCVWCLLGRSSELAREGTGVDFRGPLFVLGETIEPKVSEMKPGAWLLRAGADEGRAVNTRLLRLLPCVRKDIVSAFSLEEIATHANNVDNEESALRSRVLMRTQTPSGDGLRQWAWARDRVSQLVRGKLWGRLEKWSLSRTARHMIKRHGAGRYAWAADSLRDSPLDKRDSRVSLFIKVEKHLRTAGVLKECRAIQYRGPRYNLMLAQYLLPFEDMFCRKFQKPNITGLHTSKGLSPDKRAALILELWGRRRRPSALCIDASRFDAHVTSAMLQWEAGVYTSSYQTDVGFLAWLLRQQVYNRGRTRWGIKYGLNGCRMSGDVNTSLGNTLIQMSLLKALTWDMECDILVEGDDALVFGDTRDMRLLESSIGERARGLGMVFKSARAFAPEDLEYCSTRPVELKPDVWRSVRDYRKALVTDVYTTRPVLGEGAVAQKARMVAVCHALGAVGVPVFSAWAAVLLSHTVGGVALDPWYDRGLWLVSKERLILSLRDSAGGHPSDSYGGIADVVFSKRGTVTRLARESFYCAYGLAPSEQLALEASLWEGMGPHPPVILEGEVRQLLTG